MAVYTKINKKEVSYINKKFKIDKIINFKGIKQGIENTNYLLKSRNKKFILTIFEKRVVKKEIPFFMKLMDQLNNSKINCPKPLKNNNGKYLIKLKNKTACIVSFLNGKDKNKLDLKNCFEVGKIIAQMHLVTKNINLSRKNSMGIKNLDPLLKNIKFRSNKFSNLEKFLVNNLKEIKKNWPKKLPKGIIHADLFHDNIFFTQDKFSGIIDFYFSCEDFLAFEIAICFNALCFDGLKENLSFNVTKAKNFIDGYTSIRKLTEEEKNNIKVLSQGAALRFLLTRVFDALNTVEGAIVKIKDPVEYLKRLEFHKNSKNYEDYFF